jgi:hypothetical protein
MDSQCRSCDAHGCHCGAKNQIGLHCRKVHHVFLKKHRSPLFGLKLSAFGGKADMGISERDVCF